MPLRPFVVVVLTLTSIIKSVVTEQAPVTVEYSGMEEHPREKVKQNKSGACM